MSTAGFSGPLRETPIIVGPGQVDEDLFGMGSYVAAQELGDRVYRWGQWGRAAAAEIDDASAELLAGPGAIEVAETARGALQQMLKTLLHEQ